MANPFSGVETPFKVHANGKSYFANCAWDTLGIPAALHVDAEIEAACAQSGEPIRLSGHGSTGPEFRCAGAFPHPISGMVQRSRLYLNEHAFLPVGRNVE